MLDIQEAQNIEAAIGEGGFLEYSLRFGGKEKFSSS